MKEKALFVDFDGTICADHCWRSLAKEPQQKVQAFLFGDDRTLFNAWMRGQYTAEEINHIAAKHLDMPYEELWELFVRDCQTMRVPAEIFTALGQLRETYTLVLMTGNMDSFQRFTVPELHLDKHFDYISNSYYECKHKTDDEGSLFTDWAKKLGLPMSAIALIDDNDTCCEYFQKHGGQPYKTQGLDHTVEILKMLQSTS